ncbi:MAG TPA: phosphatase PAP2 family protein [Candidatus Babeliales bacterium]|nr:phosphatase PAP2 family protein [Candidatus Babeliales bacterium]
MKNNFYLKFLLSTIIVMMIYALSYLYLDIPLAYAAKSLSKTFLFTISTYVTRLGDDKIWTMIIIIGLLIIGIQTYQNKILSVNSKKFGYVFLSILFATVIGSVLKVILARYRPEMLFEHGLYGFHYFSLKDMYHSTPSGHALCIFAACTSLSILFRRYMVLFFLIAIIVGLSRIILTKHYLSDVILGAYIGMMSALIINHLYNIKLLTTKSSKS